jgi:pimeloyl-ACP methyl ester carboxylesterase
MTTLRLAAYPGAGPGGPTLVVLHGLGTSIDGLRDAVPRLDPFSEIAGLGVNGAGVNGAGVNGAGVNVLALDWPGHGRSGGRRGNLSYRLAMEAAATAVDVAEAEWGGPVALLGLALGGTLACYAALEDDRVAAVISQGLFDLRDIRPVLRRARQQTLLPTAAWLRRRLGQDSRRRVPLPLDLVVARSDRAFDPRLTRRLNRHPQAVSLYDLSGLGSILLSPEGKPSLAALTTPTLVVVGGQDPVLPPTAAHAASAQLSGPHELWILPAAGHQLLLEHHAALLPKVGSFLRSTLG